MSKHNQFGNSSCPEVEKKAAIGESKEANR
jgi:hypothetical protein